MAYQSIGYDKKNGIMHIWDDELGHQKFPFKPYGYLPNPTGQYQSLDGTRLEKVMGNCRDNPKSYESDLNEEVRTLIDLYYESDEPSKGHRDFFFDIETAKDENGYSTTDDVRTAITSIAYYDKLGKDRRVLILDELNRIKEHEIQGDGYVLEIFRDEKDLLTRFINIFAAIHPTVITGWNTDGYDIPYLIGRIKKVLGAQAIKKLSPAGIVEQSKSGKWKILGVSSLDYIKLYKNFTYTELPNYRLDTVAKKELGRGKVEYDGDLDTLFTQDIHKFAYYNMTDVDLIVDMDDKLQLLNLARTICHKGHVPYEDVYFASKYLDGAAIVDLKRNGFVAPNKQFRFVEDETTADALAGAYVMAPVPGLYKWIYDLDLTSLYPSIIMTANISPETKIAVIKDWNQECLLSPTATQVQFTDGTWAQDIKQWLTDMNYSVASNGAVYRNDKRGFLPTILEKWFEERVIYKDKRDTFEVGTEEYKFYDAMQLTQKVLLNSFYGVLGLKTFRFYDLDNAGAITAVGQSIIKFSAKVINNYYKKELGTDHFVNASGDKAEFAFYTDTDSTFCSSEPLIKHRFPGCNTEDEQFMIEQTNAIASEIQQTVNTMYNQYAKVFHNTTKHRFQIKQEYIAKSGLWIAKKRYAQWVIFKEGKPTDKLDVKGLDVVRSSFPEDFKKIMKETLWYILKGKDKQTTSTLIHDFKNNIKKSEVLNVMKNSSVKELSKYIKGRKPFGGYIKGTTAHAKAAINFNDMLSTLSSDILPIKDGEKVKWGYLLNNPYGFDTLALRGYQDPPEVVEFAKQYIDHNKMFTSDLSNKFNDFYAAMGWGQLPENNNAKKFFSFGK
ncbi:PolB DNA polymerase elongation subunit (family B) [uncultured Caudovirales phage]|uniref:DNA polymerase n=1 Tax=uncultured Caudovirales phage TaxID=2100421 RepID=A0A6J5NIS2_9CAUD|nr:PolB DNA polymerase elongation subunit (family B) [uncultured Caudovirales phage]CAB4170409.1 PolB DNA polymerase elongation subunit (family B) [uncultured Caudovirales phage]CAB4198634.1 PolB DNA polymerase elongation subunit (family B) [uncultured Caudovirales phage]